MLNVEGATTFNGTVYDTNNNKLAGATVLLSDSLYNVLKVVTTNSQGAYSFYVTLSGNSPYSLSVSKTGFKTQTESVTSGGTNNFYLQINFYGYIKDRNNRGIVSASVKLYNNNHVLISSDTTSSTGLYNIGANSFTSGYLKVEKTNFITETKTVSSGGSNNFNLYTSACALIVAGSSDERFNQDAYLLNNILLDHYSYQASRIFLITELTSFDGTTIPRDAAASQTNVEDACDDIDGLVGTNDDVMVFWMSHGIGHSTYCTLECGSDEMTRLELDTALDGITCNKMLVMIGSCYSGYFIGGGMVDETNRAILTACSSIEFSWGYEMSNGVAGHNYWDYGIIKALDPDLNANDADSNCNGRTSLDEFYDFAEAYVNSLEPFKTWIFGRRYYQTPQQYIGSSFSSYSTYFGDQYY